MKNKLVVITDLGCFKAYRLEYTVNSTPRLELLDEFNVIAGREKLVSQTTDMAGRFPRSTGVAGVSEMSAGERHNIELEQRKRIIKQLADRLSELLRKDNFETCFFAASKDINKAIIDELEPSLRGKISKNSPLNLTKVDKAELLAHFA